MLLQHLKRFCATSQEEEEEKVVEKVTTENNQKEEEESEVGGGKWGREGEMEEGDTVEGSAEI